jgi:hypothetical protein
MSDSWHGNLSISTDLCMSHLLSTGKMAFFDFMLLFNEKYEYGFPGIKGPAPVSIHFKDGMVEFKVITRQGLSYQKVNLFPDDLIEVSLNQESYRSAGSAATGAIIGGLLTGGVGLIAGAAIGGQRRKENHLHLLVKYANSECEIALTPSKGIPKIFAELKKMISNQTPLVQKVYNHQTASHLNLKNYTASYCREY